MWRSNKITKMLEIYENNDLVKEVIIIDNNPSSRPNLKNFKKVIIYTENKNIYVNPSWNIGYTISKYKTILANDDIYIKNFNNLINLIDKTDYDILGVEINTFGDSYIKQIDKFPAKNYGSFMYIKNYKYIDEKYKIFSGDDILFDFAKKRGIIINANVETLRSETIKSDKMLENIAMRDTSIFLKENKNKKEKKDKLKVLVCIVNYSDEQINFLKKVVNNLKSFQNYEVKIITHSNIELNIPKIDEVKIFKNLKDYNLLPLTCRKTIWENRNNYDIFIYTENDHYFVENHLDKHIEYSQILPKNRICGLIQYEKLNCDLFYPAYHGNYGWDINSVEIYDNKKFAHFSNVHQASFILTKEQLLEIGKNKDFTNYFKGSRYNLKCSVNTDIYDLSGMKKMICISEFKENLIHHLPNLYIYGDKGRRKNQRSENLRMIKTLTNLFGGTLITEKKELSIIMPTFNNTKYIDESLNTIINSGKNHNIEILVGIDGCEKTLDYIKQKTYPDFVKFYYFTTNNGPYSIKNSLAQISNSDSLLFFDSDDIMTESTINEIISNIGHYDMVRLKYKEI